MFEKFKKLDFDDKIKCGQNCNGLWYCKEINANDVKELDFLIGDVNRVLNKYNNSDNK